MFGLRRRRDARLSPVWERALALGRQSPVGHGPYETVSCLGQVVRHRQRARTGTKAYVRWVADGSVTAAWFWSARPPVHSYVLARGQYSHGDHHREAVFYVHQGHFELIPAQALAAHSREQRRLAKRSANRADATASGQVPGLYP
ncbi:MAG: hypothetical protein QOG43_142 [Actinomycetota bacterium]|nr:hypothetical protein [Actinomycetota bacterium]